MKERIELIDKAGVNDVLEEEGYTGLDEQSGYINEERINALRGSNGMRTYREMAENDSTIGAILFTLKSLIKGAKWMVQPYEDTPLDQKNADFVEECFGDMRFSMQDTIEEALNFLEYGFSVGEIVFKKRNGEQLSKTRSSKYNDKKIGIAKIAGRDQWSITQGKWHYGLAVDGTEDEVIGFRQQTISGQTADVNINNCLHLRTTVVKDNPEGKSILRNGYRSWFYKTKIENIEAIGVERDLAGLPVATIPASWMSKDADENSKALYAAMKKIVKNIRNDEQASLVLPFVPDEHGNNTIKLELMNSGGKRQFQTGEIIRRYDTGILMSVIMDFLMLGTSGGGGSYALAYTKADIFTQALRAWVNIVEDGFNTQVIPKLMNINGYNGNMPKLVAVGIEKIDGQVFINQLKMLKDMDMGFMFNDEVVKKLSEILDLPKDKGVDTKEIDVQEAMEEAEERRLGRKEVEGNKIEENENKKPVKDDEEKVKKFDALEL